MDRQDSQGVVEESANLSERTVVIADMILSSGRSGTCGP
jgi:hypothetical protein